MHQKITIDQFVFSLFFLFFFQRYLKGYLVENFERLLSRVLWQYNIFQFGFRKGYGVQHYLLLMLEIWKGATNYNKAFGALLTDLLKGS